MKSTMLLGAPVLMAAALTTAGESRVLRPGFGDRDRWRIEADGPWWALVDIRDMLNLFHPFRVSATDSAAGASRELVIPAAWRPPFALRFFCADDYFADPDKHRPGQVGTESFFGHRFKQVLIDGDVVWERDVGDENTHGSQTVFQVDLTPDVTPGKPFTLTCRVFDKRSTMERNDRDVWFIPGTWYAKGDGKTEQPPRFHTAVWFADPVLGERAAVERAPPGRRPHEAVVEARHRARWPIPPRGEQMSVPVRLELVAPTPVPGPGFPVTCGIPVPPGMLTDPDVVSLRSVDGADLPAQCRAAGLWPDGSIRWLLLNTIAPAGSHPGDAFLLGLGGEQGGARETSLTVVRHDGRLTVRTGPLQLDLGADPARLVDEVRLLPEDRAVLRHLAAEITMLRHGTATPVAAEWERVEVVEDGTVTARIELSGPLTAAGECVGRFLFRLYAHAGLPTVRTSFRIFNGTKPEPYAGTVEDAPLSITGLTMVAGIPGDVLGNVLIGVDGGDPARSTGGGDVSLLQTTPEQSTLLTAANPPVEGKRAQGWIAAAGDGGSVQASVWRFRQQCPKSLAVAQGKLRIGLFAPTETEAAYKPRFGEAKRHDVSFAFSSAPVAADTRQAFGLLADEPPRLFSAEWFCRSGGVNVLDPGWFDEHPTLKRYVADTYGDVSSARVTGRFGIRDFGDMPYNVSNQQWLNGYWAMVQGALNWGLASGDQRWLQRSFEMARHIADVDCVHVAADHPDWIAWHGLTCALGIDHSVHSPGARWPAFQIGESLILHSWMTGDPDSLAAGLANAEYLIRNRAGLGSASAREQARPMLTLLRAWQATGDLKYRDAAGEYLGLKYQTQHVIDWRRGAYIQPTYQNWRCVSAGLDAMYGHDVYEYYRLTGDPDAAQMVVALADSVYAESMLPQEEGIGSFLFYVRYSRSAWYYTQMAMLFHMAYDLTEDLRFLRAGRAAFERYLLCVDGKGKPWYQPFHNFGWLDPELGGWLQRFRHVTTRPCNITSQTPDPDPANYQP